MNAVAHMKVSFASLTLHASLVAEEFCLAVNLGE